MIVIQTEKINKIYGEIEKNSINALADVDLIIEQKEFVGIMGPSGSGKTTLLNILSGFDHPTTGSVKICGKNLQDFGDDELAEFRRDDVGFVFQDFQLLDSLTVKENIVLPLILAKKKSDIIEKKAHDIIDYLGLNKIFNKHPYEISGGEKQRTAVGRSLITNPKIIFADEPTGNLDSKSSKNIMDLFCKLNAEKESTILMVTHDPFAASFCKRIVFLFDGKIHSIIKNNGDREEFFDHIIKCQADIGGVFNDI